jgi:glycosyltransferase involved in cell wall biosynthesis
MNRPKYSVVVPVYNRPQEIEELLESLIHQTKKDFEVILVEDGSTVTCEKVYEKYHHRLPVKYFFKPNSGPGPSRNFGFEKSTGDYFVVFDSDCIIPARYFEAVDKALDQIPWDAWGGPDRGQETFSPVQRAMAFTMSSKLTTGGIRGGAAGGFQPRSFNMGIRKEVFQKTGGFWFDRFAEDIELSIRMQKLGLRVGLIPEAYVFHKRRTDFSQFFQQASNFGKGRVLVSRVHPGSLKMVHWFPALFLSGLLGLPLIAILYWPLGLAIFASYLIFGIGVGVDAWIATKSAQVSILSVPSAVVQLAGYGRGFLKEILQGRR